MSLLTKKLSYQTQAKQVLSKMAQVAKSIYVLKNIVPTRFKLLLLNALVLSHLQYSAVLLSTISCNQIITLEKQLSWAVKACFNRRKHDSSSDLKLQHNILPIRFMLDYRLATYFRLVIRNEKPAFSPDHGIAIPTAVFHKHYRTGKYITHLKSNSGLLDKSVVKKGILLHNVLPKNFDSFKQQRAKCRYKTFFMSEFKKDPGQHFYGKSNWRSFKFM